MQNIQNMMMHQQNPLVSQMLSSQVSFYRLIGVVCENYFTNFYEQHQQVNPQVERQRRRLYVGNIPPNVNDHDVRHYFNTLMRQKVCVCVEESY
jgi:hypothetical protein